MVLVFVSRQFAYLTLLLFIYFFDKPNPSFLQRYWVTAKSAIMALFSKYFPAYINILD